MVDFGMGNVVGGVLTGGYYIFLWSFIIGLVAFGVWYRWYKKQYKYSVKLKILQNKQFVYYEDVARQVVDHGTPFWYIKGLKHRTTIPPGESMYLSPTGRWVAEGYFDRAAGVIWARDTQSKEDFEEFAKNLVKDGGSRSGDATINTNFQPVTTTQRSLQANQVTKAVLRRGKDIWSVLWQLTPMIFMVIVIALILIFWGQIYQPAKDIQSQGLELIEQGGAIQQQNLRLYMMLTGGKGNGTYIVQQISDDQNTFNIPDTGLPPPMVGGSG